MANRNPCQTSAPSVATDPSRATGPTGVDGMDVFRKNVRHGPRRRRRLPPPRPGPKSHLRQIAVSSCLVLLLLSVPSAVLAKFDPYELNGGLVAAVAGRNYVLIASDTRLTDGGYGVRSRHHLGSRLWVAGPTPRLDAEVGGDETDVEDDDGEDEANESGGGENRRIFLANQDLPVTLDGSVSIPASESEIPPFLPPVPPSSERDGGGEDGGGSADPAERRVRYRLPEGDPSSLLTFVGSSGCSSDCEALKRTLRSEMTSHALWTGGAAGFRSDGARGGGAATASAPAAAASSVATALMQTLYSRRPFPYYSFCVLAGMDDVDAGGTGRVHVYDAIGSHERVAVACAGTPGREMLQPVLDRLFASASSSTAASGMKKDGDVQDSGDGEGEDVRTNNGGGGAAVALRRDGKSVPPASQRIGSLSLGPPVSTCVDCSSDEAVAMVVRAYRSVSEREISVGDSVVVCVLKRNDKEGEGNIGRGSGGAGGGGGGTLEVMRFPLKKH